MPERLQSLYDAISPQFDLGDFDSFSLKMQDETKRRSFFEAVSPEFDLGSFEEYNQKVISSFESVEKRVERELEESDSVVGRVLASRFQSKITPEPFSETETTIVESTAQLQQELPEETMKEDLPLSLQEPLALQRVEPLEPPLEQAISKGPKFLWEPDLARQKFVEGLIGERAIGVYSKLEPKTFPEKVVYGGIGLGGTVIGFIGVGRAVGSLNIGAKVLKESPKIIKFLESGLTFLAHGQIQSTSKVLVDRLEMAGTDFVTGLAFHTVGGLGRDYFKGLKGKVAKYPGMYGLGYGMSKLGGNPSDEDAMISGMLLVALTGLGDIGNVRNILIQRANTEGLKSPKKLVEAIIKKAEDFKTEKPELYEKLKETVKEAEFTKVSKKRAEEALEKAEAERLATVPDPKLVEKARVKELPPTDIVEEGRVKTIPKEAKPKVITEPSKLVKEPVLPEIKVDVPKKAEKPVEVPKIPPKKEVEDIEKPIDVKGYKGFEDKTREQNWQVSKNLNQEPLLSRFKSKIVSIKNKLTREYEHLKPNKENAELLFKLRELKGSKGVAAHNAIEKINEITKGLNKETYDLFSRKVVLDDLVAFLPKSGKIPYEFTKTELLKEHKRITQVINDNPFLKEKIAQRKKMWEGMKSEYISAMKDIGFNVKERMQQKDYFHRIVLDFANLEGIYGTGKRLKTPTGRSFLKRRKGSERNILSDYIKAEFDAISQMIADISVAKVLKTVDTKYSITKELKAEAKALNKKKPGSVQDWRELIPEGYREFQPQQGNMFYMTDAIPSRIANELLSNKMVEIGITKSDIRKVLAIGGKRQTYVIKNEIAETLENLTADQNALPQRISKQILSRWKEYQLHSPRRLIKYNVRNLSGDAEAVFVGNPSAFKKVPQAINELYNARFGDKKMTPNLKDWFERGGMESTFQAQELRHLEKLKNFANITPGKLDVNVWNKYWRGARTISDVRESVMRYSAYLDYLGQMEKTGKPKNFGASIPEEVMGLSNIKDRAFTLSNDLLGSYDRITVMGNKLRDHMIPFWSFQEINMKRYWRFARNSWGDGKMAEQAGKKILAKGLSPYTYYRVGKFTLKASALWTAMEVWNQTQFPELESGLSDEQQARPHIIFGKDEKTGETIFFDRLGILGEYLEWFGWGEPKQRVEDFLSGRKTIAQIGKEMALAPVGKFIKSSTPFIKLPAEFLTRQSLFPDPFEPRVIRDRGLYIAQQFALGDEYKALTGLPSRGYVKSLRGVAVYTSSPYESAYNGVVNKRYRYLESIGEGSRGYWMNTKSNALYNFKKASRYDDPKAGAKYIWEYFLAGGTDEGIQESLERLDPLYGFRPTKAQIKKKKLTLEDQISLAKKAKLLKGFKEYMGEDWDRIPMALKFWQETFIDRDDDYYKRVKAEIGIIKQQE